MTKKSSMLLVSIVILTLSGAWFVFRYWWVPNYFGKTKIINGPISEVTQCNATNDCVEIDEAPSRIGGNPPIDARFAQLWYPYPTPKTSKDGFLFKACISNDYFSKNQSKLYLAKSDTTASAQYCTCVAQRCSNTKYPKYNSLNITNAK